MVLTKQHVTSAIVILLIAFCPNAAGASKVKLKLDRSALIDAKEKTIRLRLNGLTVPETSADLESFTAAQMILRRAFPNVEVMPTINRGTTNTFIDVKIKRPMIVVGGAGQSNSTDNKGRAQVPKPNERGSAAVGVKRSGVIKGEVKLKDGSAEILKFKFQSDIVVGRVGQAKSDAVFVVQGLAPLIHAVCGLDTLILLLESNDESVAYGVAGYLTGAYFGDDALPLDRGKVLQTAINRSYHASSRQRLLAICLLEGLQLPVALTRLIDLLGDSDVVVQSEAKLALEFISDKSFGYDRARWLTWLQTSR